MNKKTILTIKYISYSMIISITLFIGLSELVVNLRKEHFIEMTYLNYGLIAFLVIAAFLLLLNKNPIVVDEECEKNKKDVTKIKPKEIVQQEWEYQRYNLLRREIIILLTSINVITILTSFVLQLDFLYQAISIIVVASIIQLYFASKTELPEAIPVKEEKRKWNSRNILILFIIAYVIYYGFVLLLAQTDSLDEYSVMINVITSYLLMVPTALSYIFYINKTININLGKGGWFHNGFKFFNYLASVGAIWVMVSLVF